MDDRRPALERFVRERVPGLADLPDAAVSRLVEGLCVEVVAPGSALVRRGEASGLDVVHSGLLEVREAGREGQLRRARWITRGDRVGALELLAGGPGEADVVAWRHALVARLDRAACETTLAEHPGFAAALARASLSARASRLRPGAAVYAVVAVPSLAADASPAAVWAEACRRREHTVFLSEEDARAELGDACSEADVLAAWLHEREAGARLALSYSTGAEGAWGTTCRARADCVVVLVPRKPDAGAVAAARELMSSARRAELAIVSAEGGVEAIDAWQEALGDSRVALLRGDDVGELETGLENIHAWHANPERLRAFEALAELPEEHLERVHDDIGFVSLLGGETLFAEGDTDDSAYLVYDGRIELLGDRGAGVELLNEFGPGDVVGEVTPLVGKGRRETARAVRDCTLGRIPGERFRALVDEVPGLARSLSQSLAERLQGRAYLTREEAPRNVAIVPLTGAAEAATFGRALADTMAELELDVRVVDADAADARFGAGVSESLLETPGSYPLDAWLAALERENDAVLYLCDGGPSFWTRRCLRLADLILFVADAAAEPGLREIERPLFDGTGRERPLHLVLLQRPGIREASGTSRWLDPRPGLVHHHVRRGEAADRARLARRLLRRAVGVAFSGASSRGVAHLGVLRGLASRGIPLDLVSGSSSGAAVAGLAVLGLPHEEMLQRAIRFLGSVGMKPTRLQPPLTSLMSGRAFGRAIREVFGDRLLEDQLLSCALTGVDLNHHRLVHLRRGPIWLAARASMSLPLFWPPVWHGDDLLVDGGIMSYLPIEHVLGECAGGLAVASDLDLNAGKDRPAFEGYDQYGADLSSWRTLVEGLLSRGASHRYPSIADVLFHSMCIPSFEHSRRIQHLTSQPTVRFVRPPITAEGFFTVDEPTARRHEQLAYEEALRQLKGVRIPDAGGAKT